MVVVECACSSDSYSRPSHHTLDVWTTSVRPKLWSQLIFKCRSAHIMQWSSQGEFYLFYLKRIFFAVCACSFTSTKFPPPLFFTLQVQKRPSSGRKYILYPQQPSSINRKARLLSSAKALPLILWEQNSYCLIKLYVQSNLHYACRQVCIDCHHLDQEEMPA